jgi:multimeric flavodoxin WrbA
MTIQHDQSQPSGDTKSIEVRKGQVTEKMERESFRQRFMARFYDPESRKEDESIARLEAIAWDAYIGSRKSPITAKAGSGFKDPEYDLSVEWRQARDRIAAADTRQRDPASLSRVLVVMGSSRNDFTCPGEMSKTFRLAKHAEVILQLESIEVDLLDLSHLNSEHDLHIHPCKGCVSTAMPLCHWPCSCYPNHSLGLVNDWMNEIYERFAACHGVMIVTPVYWYQVSSPIKLMMDRLVCADGGNPDPTSTHGKTPEEAKQIELDGWDYPKHLAGRAYGLVVHGDVAGIEGSRRALTDWLDWMGFIESGAMSRLDRFIGYYEPYATSHQSLDHDESVLEETANVARALAEKVRQIRRGEVQPDAKLHSPRAK